MWFRGIYYIINYKEETVIRVVFKARQTPKRIVRKRPSCRHAKKGTGPDAKFMIFDTGPPPLVRRILKLEGL